MSQASPLSSTSPVWFITGASRGIGTAIARAALRAGHRVIGAGRDPAAVGKALADAGHDRLLTVAIDVTVAAQIQTAIEAGLAHFARVDVLVNNAGYGQLGPFEEVSAEEVERQFATNVFGLMQVTRSVLPVMRRQRSGRIFNISSVGGLAGFPGSSVYCASKYAVQGFSSSLAQEVAGFGIHVTSVSPGFFRTDFLDSSSVRYGQSALLDYEELSTRLRADFGGYSHHQPGDPERLAAALVALATHASPPSNFIAGADAMELAQAELSRLKSDIGAWRTMSEGTAHR